MRSSILVNKILIDCGPDILKQIEKYRIKPEKIKAIFITHHHLDHIAGLKKFSQLIKKQIPLYASKNAWEYFQKHFKKLNFAKYITKSNKKIKIGNLIFQAIEIIHPGIKPVFAFKILSKNKTLIYMPDWKIIPKKSVKKMIKTDILILGGSSLKRNLPWHSPIVEGIEFAKKIKAKKIYFTHIGHLTLPYKKLLEFVRKSGGKKFNIAFDGLKIKL